MRRSRTASLLWTSPARTAPRAWLARGSAADAAAREPRKYRRFGVVLRDTGAALVLPPVAQSVSLPITACAAPRPSTTSGPRRFRLSLPRIAPAPPPASCVSLCAAGRAQHLHVGTVHEHVHHQLPGIVIRDAQLEAAVFTEPALLVPMPALLGHPSSPFGRERQHRGVPGDAGEDAIGPGKMAVQALVVDVRRRRAGARGLTATVARPMPIPATIPPVARDG